MHRQFEVNTKIVCIHTHTQTHTHIYKFHTQDTLSYQNYS